MESNKIYSFEWDITEIFNKFCVNIESRLNILTFIG